MIDDIIMNSNPLSPPFQEKITINKKNIFLKG